MLVVAELSVMSLQIADKADGSRVGGVHASGEDGCGLGPGVSLVHIRFVLPSFEFGRGSQICRRRHCQLRSPDSYTCHCLLVDILHSTTYHYNTHNSLTMATQRLSNVLSHITPGKSPLEQMYASHTPLHNFPQIVSIRNGLFN